MKFKLELDMNGAAFDTDPAIAVGGILTQLAEDIMQDGFTNVGTETLHGVRGSLRDGNGNTVGQWTVSLYKRNS